MDNDNKIESKKITPAQRHKEVLLFLNDELNNIQTSSSTFNTYNLEKEYAKTKKNRSPFVFLVLFVCFLVTVGIAWGLSLTITKQNQSISVNLQEFDSLNLRALLDSVAKAQDKYDVAVHDRDMLVSARDNELKAAETKRDDDLFVLETISNVDPASAKSKRREIMAEYNQKIEEIKEQYEKKIADLEVKIDEYREELNSYDSSKVASAKEIDRSNAGDYQIQEMEKKKIADKYESQIKELQIQIDALSSSKSTRSAVAQVSNKYQSEINRLDPLIKDEKANELVKDNKFRLVKTYSSEEMIQTNELTDEELVNKLQEYQQLYDNYKYLRNYVAGIPQKKSIPDFVTVTNKLVDQMGENYTETTLSLVEQKNKLLAQIEDLQAQIEEEKLNHETVVAQMVEQSTLEKTTLEQYYKRINYNYTDCLNQMLSYTQSSAVVAYATSKESVVVYVVPRARFNIEETGTPVEVYSTKVITGRLVPFENGYYKFLPALDEEGNEIDFNVKDIVPGSLVKILAAEVE